VFATLQAQNNGRRNDVYLYYFNREVPKKYSAAVEAKYQPEEFLGTYIIIIQCFAWTCIRTSDHDRRFVSVETFSANA
jgi:hypothetical protein